MTNDTKMRLDLETVRGAIHRAVEENGEGHVVDPGMCSYAHYIPGTNTPGSPGCIVGYALHYLGWSLEDLAVLDGTHVTSPASNLDNTQIDTLVRAGLVDIELDALRYLQRAQKEQDCGVPWGIAVERAEETVK